MGKEKISDEKILEYDNVPVSVAAQYIDKSPEFLRCAMQSQRCPFGLGVKMHGGEWSYSISPGMLVAYKSGGMIVHIRNSRELIPGMVYDGC